MGGTSAQKDAYSTPLTAAKIITPTITRATASRTIFLVFVICFPSNYYLTDRAGAIRKKGRGGNKKAAGVLRLRKQS
jgi:hypothetical protein